MMRFEWNALGQGNAVRVHEGLGPELTVGTVAFVDMQRGSNGVGIRLRAGEPGSEVLWPSRMAVHLAAGADESCWRCESPAT